MENLPVKFVSQLKVYDKPTKQEEATGMKSAEKNYVLDLQTKKESEQRHTFISRRWLWDS